MTSNTTFVEGAGLTYRWHEPWANLEPTKGWAHHDLVISSEGYIIVGDCESSKIIFLNSNGDVVKSWEVDVVETHGFCLSEEGGKEFLWIADIGRRRSSENYEYPHENDGKVIKMSMDGELLASFDKSHLKSYQQDTYFSPSALAINSQNGDVWVADGYGQFLIHRLDKDFNHIQSIDGEAGPEKFRIPHAIIIDNRKEEGELYITDRIHNRVQVYDLNGEYKRSVGKEGELQYPTGFSIYGDKMFIAELKGRIAVYDLEDKLLGYLCDGIEYTSCPGWPNRYGQDKTPIAPNDLQAGKLNSPHGIDIDSNGNIYISEWLIGGRFIKLGSVEGH